MNVILPALGAGACAGGIIMLLSHLAPYFSATNKIPDVDQPHVFGQMITRREAHLLGMLLHLVISSVWGGLYALLVQLGVIAGFGFVPIFVWGIVLALVIGGIIFPLEGHGIFGVHEDKWFPIDLALTNLLWTVLFWWLIRLWLGLALFS